jgi:hypothetical protein
MQGEKKIRLNEEKSPELYVVTAQVVENPVVEFDGREPMHSLWPRGRPPFITPRRGGRSMSSCDLKKSSSPS